MIPLIKKMTAREISSRYKDSFLGIFWSFLTPLFMFVVYAFVFSSIFQSKWGTDIATGNRFEYSILLFTGLILHTLFSETLLQSVTAIQTNVSYVKKIVFPVQILPIVKLNSALFHAFISLAILLLLNGIITYRIEWTIVFIPVVLFPFLILILGLGWFLSALGVYVKDAVQVLNPVLTALLFIGPVLYPRSVLPEGLQPYLYLNPLTTIVEQMQAILIWGQTPNFMALLIYTVISTIFASLGYLWFKKLQPGFSDVL